MANVPKLVIDLGPVSEIAFMDADCDAAMTLELVGQEHATEDTIAMALRKVRQLKRALAQAEESMIIQANKKLLERNLTLF